MKKILIVDDEPNIVMTLEYTFKKSNYEVFIEHHKGKIWVQPSVKGACIVFTLPVKNIKN